MCCYVDDLKGDPSLSQPKPGHVVNSSYGTQTPKGVCGGVVEDVACKSGNHEGCGLSVVCGHVCLRLGAVGSATPSLPRWGTRRGKAWIGPFLLERTFGTLSLNDTRILLGFFARGRKGATRLIINSRGFSSGSIGPVLFKTYEEFASWGF